VIFHTNYHFLDLFFSNSFWRPCAIKFGGDCRCHRISSDVVSVSVLKTELGFVLAFLGAVARMSSHSISGRDSGYCNNRPQVRPSFCCMDIFATFFNYRFLFMFIFNSTVKSVPCRRLNHDQNHKALC
jgi:hypothetical protein